MYLMRRELGERYDGTKRSCVAPTKGVRLVLRTAGWPLRGEVLVCAPRSAMHDSGIDRDVNKEEGDCHLEFEEENFMVHNATACIYLMSRLWILCHPLLFSLPIPN